LVDRQAVGGAARDEGRRRHPSCGRPAAAATNASVSLSTPEMP
jgi:hypothetical protein